MSGQRSSSKPRSMPPARRTWFEAVGERVRALVRRRVAEAVDDRPDEFEAVSDLTQEALLTASERFEEFRGATEAELVAWVCAIAETKLSDHRRALRRKKCDVRRTRSLDTTPQETPDDAGGPDDAILLAEERAFVRGLIDALPTLERKAIRLRYLEERPVTEVAAHLYRSEDGAKGVLKRGLRRLRERARVVPESSPDSAPYGPQPPRETESFTGGQAEEAS